MDFSKFEKVDNTFERKGGYTLVKEQEYSSLKYRKAVKKTKDADGKETETVEGRFYIANELFVSAGLATNGLRQFTTPDGSETVLAVVADEHAGILKASKKSKEGNKVKNFKSPKLEAALAQAGIIDTTKVGVNQFIDAKVIGTNADIKGVPCITVYGLSVGAAKPKTEAPAKAEVVAAPAGVTPVAAAPVAAGNGWD